MDVDIWVMFVCGSDLVAHPKKSTALSLLDLSFFVMHEKLRTVK